MSLITRALERTAAARESLPALRYKLNDQWVEITWREYRESVRRVGRALIALGIAPQEHVVILGYNCPQWFMADIGAIVAGVIPTGIYTTSTAEQCRYIADHCDARVAFVENAEHLAKFLEVREQLPRLSAIVLMHGASKEEGVLSWADFLALAEDVPEAQLDARIEAQQPNDVATLIYTSGTTGVPKAVMLTHANLVWLIETAGRIANVLPGEHLISYLPLSHVAEQNFSLFGNVILGVTVSFAESLDTLGDTLREVRPHHFLAVPRVWEKIQERMEAAGAAAPSARRTIIRWARSVGLRGGYASQDGRRKALLYPVAEKLVFSNVRKALGLDRAKILITGAAPISKRTLEFFLSLGMPICELYGMSECTAITTVSTPARYRTGKAGVAIPGTEVRVADDGEICIRGPHVFKGYYKDADATREAVDDEGWLHSGDVGEIDAEGFVQITDRKKELIITAGGENIAPAFVEGQLKSIPLISQAVVIGDRRRYLSALITLDAEKIPAAASIVGSPARSLIEASACEKITVHLRRQIDTVNARLARVQTVKRFTILPNELTVEGGELTATMKLRRKIINEKYADIIEGMYES